MGWPTGQERAEAIAEHLGGDTKAVELDGKWYVIQDQVLRDPALRMEPVTEPSTLRTAIEQGLAIDLNPDLAGYRSTTW